MRVLILVISSDEPPFDSLRKAQMETWGSKVHPNVDVVWYLSSNETSLRGWELYLECSKDFYQQHWRTKLAIDFLWDVPWDFLYLTNAGSYANTFGIYEVAKTLPLTKCYAGEDKETYAGGANVFLSRDVADLLRANLKQEDEVAGDVLFGRVIMGSGVPLIPLPCCHYAGDSPFSPDIGIDYVTGGPPIEYHYILKTLDRNMDIQNMHRIHGVVRLLY